MSRTDAAEVFRALHVPGTPLLMPNPWDAGSARLMAWQGFRALATTSSGHAGTLGRLDGDVSRDEALAHAADVVAAVDVPVSADLENGFADDPAGVAETIEGAVRAGLAGCSIEDYTGDDDAPFYELDAAASRIEAAANTARASGLVLTVRAENHIRGNFDLDDTIARLRAYGEAGADVLYAPGLREEAEIRRVVESVGRPVNVLAIPGAPDVATLAAAGVARVSVGGAFSQVALAAVAAAGSELLERGSYGFLDDAATGREIAGQAFAAGRRG